MNKVVVPLDLGIYNRKPLHAYLPPGTTVLKSIRDDCTMNFILWVKYDFNWTVNRVSPRGDNIGADFDFNREGDE